MKKMYKTIRLFAVLSLLGTAGLHAQPLSGTVTVNSGLSTGSGNYQSFTALATALNAQGINGPLVVNVAPSTGPYNEQPQFNAITGTSATNTITVNGNGNLMTFNSSSSAAAWTLLLNGADYMYWNNLNFYNGGATYAIPCYLTNASDYNTFSSCTFSCPANGSGSYQIAVHMSASASSPQSTGSNSGNYNTWRNCQMFSGYYCVMFYGLTSAPFQQGNRLIGNTIEDYYVYGLYFYYQAYGVVSGNTFQRPTRTSLTTFYGMLIYYNSGTVVENNIVQKPCEQAPSTSITSYCLYWYAASTAVFTQNFYRNNIVRNIRQAGTCYAIYCYYASGDVYHNTVSIDDQTTNTSLSVYGIYSGNTTSYLPFTIKNNLISITKIGTGTRYGIYVGSASNVSLDGNNVYVNQSSATNYHGYWNAVVSNFAAWQALGNDLNGSNQNPNFVNIVSDLHPTNAAMNNLGLPLGLLFDQLGAVRNQSTPDQGALEFLTPMCTGTPTNGVSGPTYSLCSGESADFMISNLTAADGITYQWQMSNVSAVGPWTTLSGANTVSYTANNITQPGWYSAVITCTAPGGGAATAVAAVYLAGNVSSTVPYFEDFEGIGRTNRLPNCSWKAPAMGAAAKTYTSAQTGNRLPKSGASFATFENTAPTNYYYSNPIFMEAGVTYSASLWYQTDLTGATNWTDLSIMIGSGQTSAGLTTIASSNGPAVSPIYKPLSNLFTVASSGTYIVAVRATAGSGSASYLTWDDLRIEIPCTPSVNVVNLAVAVPNYTVCQGASLVMTASGANTYLWNTGNTTPVLSQTPVVNPSFYSVTGTNTLTGCSATKNMIINVKAAPVVVASAYPPVSCEGKDVILTAGGAGNYAWSTSQSGANITVAPTTNASYTVIGTNAQNCSSSAVVNVVVNSNPAINVSAPQVICTGEVAMMQASGAQSYQWISNTGYIQTNPAFVSPMLGSTTFTVIGTDALGCQGQQIVNMVVDACTGISQASSSNGLNVYPNPTNGNITIELGTGSAVNIHVTDVTGRVLFNTDVNADKTSVDLTSFAAGVYYVKIQTGSQVETVKVIRN